MQKKKKKNFLGEGGVCSGERGSALGGVCSGGCLLGGGGGIPSCTEADTPHHVDRQMPVKT